MSRHGDITLPYGDGDHLFRLDVKRLIELETACNCGPFVLEEKFRNRRCTTKEMREAIRLGLDGGGLEPVKALSLLKRYFDERSPLESWYAAYAVIQAALLPGAEPFPLFQAAAETHAEVSTMAASASPSSTDGDQPSASDRATSMN